MKSKRAVPRVIPEIVESDVLVIGGGLAGLMAAIRSAASGAETILVEKSYVGRSGSSVFAAGLLNLCLPEDDAGVWMREIIENGEYLNDQEWIRIVLGETVPLAMELEEWGKARNLSLLRRDAAGRLIRKKSRGNIHTRTSFIQAKPAMEVLRAKALETRRGLFF